MASEENPGKLFRYGERFLGLPNRTTFVRGVACHICPSYLFPRTSIDLVVWLSQRKEGSGNLTPARLCFDNLIPHSVPYQLADRMDLKLPHNVGSMRFGSLHTDPEGDRNFLAALAFGE